MMNFSVQTRTAANLSSKGSQPNSSSSPSSDAWSTTLFPYITIAENFPLPKIIEKLFKKRAVQNDADFLYYYPPFYFSRTKYRILSLVLHLSSFLILSLV